MHLVEFVLTLNYDAWNRELKKNRDASELDSLHSPGIILIAVSSFMVCLVNLTAFVLCGMRHVLIRLVYFMLPEIVSILFEINFHVFIIKEPTTCSYRASKIHKILYFFLHVLVVDHLIRE